MTNWFVNKNEIKNKTINAIMGELEYLLDETIGVYTANYWIDDTHNVFAFINDNGDGDRWIEIHYELHDRDELYITDNLIGDLLVLDTEDVNREGLLKEVIAIVDAYYGD